MLSIDNNYPFIDLAYYPLIVSDDTDPYEVEEEPDDDIEDDDDNWDDIEDDDDDDDDDDWLYDLTIRN